MAGPAPAAVKYEDYRANHQSGHGSAVFTWIDAAHEYADSQSKTPPLLEEHPAAAPKDETLAPREDSSIHHSNRNLLADAQPHHLIGGSEVLTGYHPGSTEPWDPQRTDWTALPESPGGTAVWAAPTGSGPGPGLWANDPQWTSDPALQGGGNLPGPGGDAPADGTTHSVPEPGTLGLFALGIAAALRRYRRI